MEEENWLDKVTDMSPWLNFRDRVFLPRDFHKGVCSSPPALGLLSCSVMVVQGGYHIRCDCVLLRTCGLVTATLSNIL